MSDEHSPDEMWTTANGDKIAIGDLSEQQVKDILRKLIKNDREELAYFNTYIMPQITGCIDDLADLAKMIEVEIHDDVNAAAYQRSADAGFSLIEDAFDRADQDWKRK